MANATSNRVAGNGEWRALRGIAVGVVAVMAAGCAGSSPTGPSRQMAAVDTTVAVASGQSAGAQVSTSAKPLSGTASTQLVEVSPGVFGFAAGTQNGVTGRFVTLIGTILGINFEPGTCLPGVDMTLGFPTSCLLFGDGPGQFQRAHAGGTAFTTCHCSVGGVGSGDQVTLKISYPPATPPKYPAGFTKFTFQGGTGALAGLRGQGTLDFASNPAVSFTYHFTAAP